jgi:hypothetical protein
MITPKNLKNTIIRLKEHKIQIIYLFGKIISE